MTVSSFDVLPPFLNFLHKILQKVLNRNIKKYKINMSDDLFDCFGSDDELTMSVIIRLLKNMNMIHSKAPVIHLPKS